MLRAPGLLQLLSDAMRWCQKKDDHSVCNVPCACMLALELHPQQLNARESQLTGL